MSACSIFAGPVTIINQKQNEKNLGDRKYDINGNIATNVYKNPNIDMLYATICLMPKYHIATYIVIATIFHIYISCFTCW